MILRGIVFVVAALSVALGVIVFAQYQSKSRAPKLSSDEVAGGKATPSAGKAGGGGSASSASGGGAIAWQYTMSSALREAKANDGLVIVDIYTDWCGWCKRMDKDIYGAPSVVALSGKDVFLKYNAEDGGEGEAYSRKMGVRGFPTTFILNSDGKLLQTARGYLGSPQKFISLVETTRTQK